MELFAAFLGGLGLFFIGIKLVGTHLKNLTGRRFRRFVASSTAKPSASAAVGLLAGGLTQSSNAVTFIAISLVTAGLTTAPQVAPLVAWANVGTAGLVMLAAVDLRLLVFFLLGMVGIAYYFDLDQSARWRHAAGALLGLGLLFLGLQLIKATGVPLRDLPWMGAFIQFAASSDLLGLGVGLLLGVALQSSATLTVIAVTLTGLGLLSLEHTVMLVLGGGLGSGASIALMALNLGGTARQLALFQVAVKCLGTLLVLLLVWLERFGQLPLLLDLVRRLHVDSAMQVALIFLMVQLAGALLGMLLRDPLLRLLARFVPPDPEEGLSRPRYLYDQALEDAATALDLAEREEEELIARLPSLLPAEGEEVRPVEAVRALNANIQLAQEIDRFLEELLHRGADEESLEAAMSLKGRNQLAIALCESLRELLAALSAVGTSGPGVRLPQHLVEASHALLMSLCEVVREKDPLDRVLLRELTGDRTELMESVRRDLLRNGANLDQRHRDSLFTATSLFERLVWLVRRYAAQLPEPLPEAAGRTTP